MMKRKKNIIALLLIMMLAVLFVACNDSITYRITFKAEGQSDIVHEINEGQSLSKIPSVPEKAGYKGEWSISDFSTITAHTTVTAVYTPIKYKIEFNVNDGVIDTPYEDEYTIESDKFTLPIPEKQGFTFIGWYDNEGFTGEPIAELHKGSTGNKSFHAKWEQLTQESYTVTLISFGHDDAQLSGEGTYYQNDSVTIIAATNEEGYIFSGWFDDQVKISDTAEYTFTMLAKNIQYEAKWQKSKFTVSLTTDIKEIFLIGGGEYEWGTTIDVSIEKNEKFIFIKWVDEHENVVSQYASFEYVVPKKDITLVAVFEEITYPNELSVINDNSDAGVVTDGGMYYAGEEVELRATANEGYVFIGWYQGETFISDKTNYYFTMPDTFTEYTAKWEKQKYRLSVSGIDLYGTVTGMGEYEWGRQVTLTAEPTPNTGYKFLGYYEGEKLKERSHTYTFTMPKNDVELTIKWEIEKFPLRLESNIADVGTLSGAGEYAPGTIVTITATANEGYTFISWYQYGQEVSTEAEYPVEIQSYKLIYQARFEKNKYNIKLTNSDVNKGTVLGAGEFEWGTSVTLMATAKDGYSFDGWQDKYGQIESYDLEFTFEMPKENITYTALWKEGTEGLTYAPLPDGTYAVTGGGNTQNLIIPATHKGINVTEIQYGAFSGKSFESLKFTHSSNIRVIESNAFNGRIKKIIFPQNKIVVESRAFNSDTQTAELLNYSFEYGLPLSQANLVTVSIIDTAIPANIFQNFSKLRNVDFINQVQSIGSYAFADCTSLSEINLNGVTTIGNYAFSGSGLISIVVPESVTSLGSGIFYNCKSLTDAYINAQLNELPEMIFSNANNLSIIHLNDYIKIIGNVAFSGCQKLSYITLPQNLTSIGDSAFYDSGLTSIALPETIVNIGSMAFGKCINLEGIVLPAALQSAAGILSESTGIKHLTAPITPDIQTIQSYFMLNGNEASSLKSFTINGGSTISENFFSRASNLEEIVIGDTISSISLTAFKTGKLLRNITVDGQNQNFVSIGGVLYSKDKTELIKYPAQKIDEHIMGSNVQEIYPYAFEHSLVTAVSLPNVRTIGSFAFASCYELTEIDFTGNTVMSEIGSYAFAHNDKITELKLPATVNVIGKGVLFNSKNISRISLPFVGQYGDGTGDTKFNYLFKGFDVTSFEKLVSVEILGGSVIGDDAFNGLSHIQELTLPNYGLQAIGKQAFSGLFRVSNINIPYGVEHIGEEALKGMSAVTQLFIPDTVENIGANAFASMSGLKYIRIPFIGKSIDGGRFSEVFSDTADFCRVVVASGEIGNYAFYNFNKITEIELPNGATYIGEYAFNGLNQIEYIDIPKTVNHIGRYAFYGMASLKELVIPDGVTEIQRHTLQGLSSLTKITVPFVGSSLNNPIDTSFSYIFGGGTDWLNSNAYVPQTLKTVIVTGGSVIGERAFWGLQYITSLTLPESITSIQQSALMGMSGIQELVLPFIGTSEFEGNELYRLFNTDYSEYIPNSLKTLHISRGVILKDSLSDYLSSNSIVEIFIGGGVSFIDSDAFLVSKLLAEIYVDKNNAEYRSTDGILLSKDGARLIKFPSQKAMEEFVLPSTVLEIEKNAFNGASYLKSITALSHLESIGEYAFANSSIESAVFDGAYSISSLGDGLFYKANELKSLVLPFIPGDFMDVFALTSPSFSIKINSGEKIYDRMFYGLQGLKHIVLPDSLQFIGNYALSGTQITELVIPSSVQSVGVGALRGRSLASLTLPMKSDWSLLEIFDGVSGDLFVSITGSNPINSSDAFNLRNLKGISVEPSNAYYHTEGGVLYSKNKQRLIKYPAAKEGIDFTVPAAVKEIGDYAFYYCINLSYVDFQSDGLHLVGSYAFASSTIASINLPATLQYIGNYMFEYCDNLKDINIPANVKAIGSYAFTYSGLETVNFATDSVLTSIDYGAFSGTNIKSIKLPIGIEHLQRDVFQNCRELSSVTLNEGLLYIESNAFFRNYSLKSIVIPSTVIGIGNNAFYESQIEEISFAHDSKLERIGESAFENTMLKKVTLPSSLTRISLRAFANCGDLWEIILPENVTISAQAFVDTAIKSIIIPDGAVIESNGLQHKFLETIFFGEGVTLQEKAVVDSSHLGLVEIPSSIKMGKDAFYNCVFVFFMTESAADSDEWADGWNSGYRVYYSGVLACDNNFEYYIVNEEYIVITSYVGQEENIEIPSTIGGVTVKAIERNAFKDSVAETIFIPLEVEIIKLGAFMDYSGTILCEAESKPLEWQLGWVGSANVIWGYQV